MLDEHRNIKFRDKSLYSIFSPLLEEHPNIEFSDKLAILDIWPHNFEYTGRFFYIRSYGASAPIFDFTGRGHFVTNLIFGHKMTMYIRG